MHLYAPLKQNWYDKISVKMALKCKYDVVLIDVSIAHLRGGILQNLDLFNELRIPVIFDDVNRPYDKEIMINFCEKLRYAYEIQNGKFKQFAYCVNLK